MGKFVIKAALGFIIAVMVVCLAMVFALPSLISSNFARQKIEGYVSQGLKKPVSIEGISFSWGEGLAVSNFKSVNSDQTPL